MAAVEGTGPGADTRRLGDREQERSLAHLHLRAAGHTELRGRTDRRPRVRAPAEQKRDGMRNRPSRTLETLSLPVHLYLLLEAGRPEISILHR